MPKARASDKKYLAQYFAKGTAEENRPIKIPLGALNYWDAELQSALVLLQEAAKNVRAGGVLGQINADSMLDGAHALIENVSSGVCSAKKPDPKRS